MLMKAEGLMGKLKVKKKDLVNYLRKKQFYLPERQFWYFINERMVFVKLIFNCYQLLNIDAGESIGEQWIFWLLV